MWADTELVCGIVPGYRSGHEIKLKLQFLSVELCRVVHDH